jgi:hypothetical protein
VLAIHLVVLQGLGWLRLAGCASQCFNTLRTFSADLTVLIYVAPNFTAVVFERSEFLL